MIKVVLVGNPNVGKSLLFSRITRISIATANYAGTTVEMKAGACRYRDSEYEIIDGPGIYSLEEYSKTDEIALNLIEDADILVNIMDATNLERNLALTLQLMEKKKPMVVCLNFWEDTVHKGVEINTEVLGTLLDLPLVTVSALRNEGMSELLAFLDQARVSTVPVEPEDQWSQIGNIVKKTQKLTHRHHTFLETLSDITLHPIGGIASAVVVLIATLLLVRYIGEGLINVLFEPFYSDLYNPLIQDLAKEIPNSFISGLLVGHTADPLGSFGILTSGVYIALVSVFPYFFSFYMIFGFLEDFGYLPRLAVVLDKFFHKLGLHGYSSIPVILGLGCKVPAFMSTRGLTNRREKILTISLILMSAPCLSQSAMIVSLGMNYGAVTVLAIYAILIALALGMNFFLSWVFKKGDTPEFFTEFPAYRLPSVKLMAGKLWLRIKEYFAEVLPMIAVGVLAMNILEALHVLGFITELIKKPLDLLLGLPADIAPVMLLNFLRKDASIALLVPMHLTAHQFLIACLFLTLSTPCIASLFTMMKELGVKTALKIAGVILLTAIAATTLLHLFFTFFQ